MKESAEIGEVVVKAGEAEPGGKVEVSIVVPIDAPGGEIGELAQAYSREMEVVGRSFELVFVLDGIAGEPREQVLALKAQGLPVTMVSLARPFGYSTALSAGVEQSRGDILITSPDYMQVDPVEIRRLLAALDSGADLVSPWRSQRVDPLLNRVQSRLFNALLRRIVRMPFHDLNCNFRAMRRQVLEDITIYGDLHRFLPVMALRQGFRVEEVKVRHLHERGRAGFFGFGVYVRRFLDILAVTFLTKFTHKPLRFFGIVGSLFALVGLMICLYLTYQWFNASLGGDPGEEGLRNRPLLILGAILIVLGVQFVGMGLVGEIIIFTRARSIKEYKIERIDE